ncbi:hypothetical protein ABZX95_08965 [Streptomyces sp. NPDC004232]|uniref:hypothetical protein n=1 Tax=unclassified Streptomyces TaxID=2593676 RepID=UPI00339FC4AB
MPDAPIAESYGGGGVVVLPARRRRAHRRGGDARDSPARLRLRLHHVLRLPRW